MDQNPYDDPQAAAIVAQIANLLGQTEQVLAVAVQIKPGADKTRASVIATTERLLIYKPYAGSSDSIVEFPWGVVRELYLAEGPASTTLTLLLTHKRQVIVESLPREAARAIDQARWNRGPRRGPSQWAAPTFMPSGPGPGPVGPGPGGGSSPGPYPRVPVPLVFRRPAPPAGRFRNPLVLVLVVVGFICLGCCGMNTLTSLVGHTGPVPASRGVSARTPPPAALGRNSATQTAIVAATREAGGVPPAPSGPPPAPSGGNRATATARIAATREAAAPAPTPTVVLTFGDTVPDFQHWLFSLAKMEVRMSLVGADDQVVTPHQGRFWLIWFDARNKDTSAHALDEDFAFHLYAADSSQVGEAWSADRDQLGPVIRQEGRDLLDASTADGAVTHPLLIFDMPANATPARLTIERRFPYGDQLITFDVSSSVSAALAALAPQATATAQAQATINSAHGVEDATPPPGVLGLGDTVPNFRGWLISLAKIEARPALVDVNGDLIYPSGDWWWAVSVDARNLGATPRSLDESFAVYLHDDQGHQVSEAGAYQSYRLDPGIHNAGRDTFGVSTAPQSVTHPLLLFELAPGRTPVQLIITRRGDSSERVAFDLTSGVAQALKQAAPQATALARTAAKTATAIAVRLCPPGTRYGAQCRDGTQSNATGQGACSHHDGVARWLICPSP